MKQQRKTFLTLILVLSLVLTACGGIGNGDGSDGGPIKDLNLWDYAVSEVSNFFILNTEAGVNMDVLCNLYSGLLETDFKGQLHPAVATEWGSDDGGLTWTFKLRDDVTWVDMDGKYMADCTAQDWITALEWVLNFQKNGGNNVYMPCAMIQGAQEYYEYTVGLTEEEGKALDTSLFLEMVGIEAPNDYELIYHCVQNTPYFDTLTVSACLYPISQALIDELGVDGMVGMDNKDMWYNGPYTMTFFIPGNEKLLTRNPAYWDTEATLFDTVSIRMLDDASTANVLFQTGETDVVGLDDAMLHSILEAGEKSPYYKCMVESPATLSEQIIFNFAKNNADGTPDTNWNTAIANEAFRLSLYYGLDFSSYWASYDPIEPMRHDNLAYSMKDMFYFSDGTDYVDKVVGQLNFPAGDGSASRRYNPALAEQYKSRAIRELTEKGVTFPVEIDYYIPGGMQSSLDAANLFRQIFSGLGDDYVRMNIKTYVSNSYQEVFIPKLQSFDISAWMADYGDPETFLAQNLYGADGGYFTMYLTNVNDAADEDLIAVYKEFTELERKANQISDDRDARYQAYVDAEVYMLQHALMIPFSYDGAWKLTKINDYSKHCATYGIQRNMYKNWETSTNIYTTDEYKQLEAEVDL